MSIEVKQIITIKELKKFIFMAPFFFEEMNLPGTFNKDIFIASWKHILENEIGVVFGLVDSKPIGALGAIVHPDINDGSLVATELYWFVDRKYRGHGKMLLKSFEEWAKVRGAVRIIMAAMTGPSLDKLNSLYTKMNYRPMEVHYVKELTNGTGNHE